MANDLESYVNVMVSDPASFSPESLYKVFFQFSSYLAKRASVHSADIIENAIYRFCYSIHSLPILLSPNGPLDRLVISIISKPSPKLLSSLLPILSALLTVNSSIRSRVLHHCELRPKLFSSTTNIDLCHVIRSKILEFDPKLDNSIPIRPKKPRFQPVISPKSTPTINVDLHQSSPIKKSHSSQSQSIDFSSPFVFSFAGSFGIPGSTDGQLSTSLFNQPSDVIATPKLGKYFVVDWGSETIRVINLNDDGMGSTVETVVNSQGNPVKIPKISKILPCTFQEPEAQFLGLSTEQCTLSLISNNSNNSTFKLFGGIRAQIPGSFKNCSVADPSDFCFITPQMGYAADVSGIWRVDFDRHAITLIAGQIGNVGFTSGPTLGLSALFNRPSSIVSIDPQSLLIADCCNHVIRLLRFDPTFKSCTVSVFAGSVKGTQDGSVASCKFTFPQKMTFDRSKDICF
ncbi:hypothetical protein GEMRC1_005165 [Eukaryota sp. GEM-RC1]